MGLLKFLPSRQKAMQLQEATLVADLDALISKPLKFQLLGKEHLIKPLTNEEFFRYANAAGHVSKILGSSEATQEERIDAAFGVVSSVCESLSRSDLDKITPSQLGALLSLIAECVVGKAYVDTEKKNIKT